MTSIKRELPTDTTSSPTSKKPKTDESPSSSSSFASTLFWFRTDLRLSDNTALYKAYLASQATKTPLIALYIISPEDWKRHDIAKIKVNFLLRSLAKLQTSLKGKHIPLVVKTALSVAAVPGLVLSVAQEVKAKELYFNIEYEVNEGRRDAKVKELMGKSGLKVHDFHDQCVVPPGVCKTKEERTYTVFTPFKKCWYSVLYQNQNYLKISPEPEKQDPTSIPTSIQQYIDASSTIPTKISAHYDDFPASEITKATERFPSGEDIAMKKLDAFVANRIAKYKTDRDFPSIDGTSSLSPYLAAGSISARQCVDKALKANKNKLDSGNEGIVCWISEIVWRDFYRNILVAFPRVCMNKPFKLDTDRVAWSYDKDSFEKWCQGKTGYPIVDAGMRQLNETGWMHNRLRMVVAMFLTKHLLIDWRMGEKYFSEKLIDQDFASNNGGWQWAASTGTDSQPYFRIFNPLLQSQRFDASGEFVKRFVPELKDVKGKAIHEPHEVLSKKEFEKLGYPAPMVKHTEARDRCLAAFKAAIGKKE